MTTQTLADLGWSAHERAQCGDIDFETSTPFRIAAVDRDRLLGLNEMGEVPLLPESGRSTGDYAVGDWVLATDGRVSHLLERRSAIRRRAAGTEAREQLIAANVDLLVIVTSCNADFNPARIERYLALAAASGVMPLIVLTKADLAPDAEDYARAAEALSPLAAVEVVDARNPEEAAKIAAWCRQGQTLALVGSSGVGKTTLTNALTGRADATAVIREDDAKGRHTTTRRHLLPATGGLWVLDTPGMRALRLADAAEGIAEVFSDIGDLAEGCRFRDCAHQGEPGCAVQAAIEDGSLEPARLERWRNLGREDARNSRSIAEARASERAFGRMVRDAMDVKKKR